MCHAITENNIFVIVPTIVLKGYPGKRRSQGRRYFYKFNIKYLRNHISTYIIN